MRRGACAPSCDPTSSWRRPSVAAPISRRPSRIRCGASSATTAPSRRSACWSIRCAPGARFGLDAGETFSANIQYIYRKQLEEADVIVITQVRPAARRSDSTNCAPCCSASFRTPTCSRSRRATRPDSMPGSGGSLFSEQQPRAVMAVDYDRYADGEARLGWLNASVHGGARERPRDGNPLLAELGAGSSAQRSHERGAMIAHLKMTLHAGRADRRDQPGAERFRARTGRAAAGARSTAGDLTVNLRAEAAPDLLEPCCASRSRGRLALETGGSNSCTSRHSGRGAPSRRIAMALRRRVLDLLHVDRAGLHLEERLAAAHAHRAVPGRGREEGSEVALDARLQVQHLSTAS